MVVFENGGSVESDSGASFSVSRGRYDLVASERPSSYTQKINTGVRHER